MRSDQRLALISAVFLSMAYFVNGPGAGQTQPNTNRVAKLPANKAREAKTLFKQNCVKCHGVDGLGDTTDGEILGTPDFTDSKWQEKSDDRRLLDSITHGRGQMPPFEKKLSKEQVKILLAHVRAFKS